MSRTLTANAQAQANATAAKPFNVLKVRTPSAALPGGAIYWQFDEGSGNYCASNLGTADTQLTKKSTTTWETGKYGHGLGRAWYGYLASRSCTAALDPGGQNRLTLAMWTRYASHTVYQFSIGPGYGQAPLLGFMFYHGSQGGMRFFLRVDGLKMEKVCAAFTQAGANHWTIVVDLTAAAGEKIRIYKNAVRYDAGQVESNPGSTIGSLLNQAAFGPGWMYEYPAGSYIVDELLWVPGWAATQAEIEALYNNTLSGLSGWVHLSDAERVLSATITAKPCVVDWGSVSIPGSAIGSQQEGSLYPLADYSVRLHLADASVRSVFMGTWPPVGEKAILYQYWDAPGLIWPTDAVVLYEGTVGSVAGGSAQSFRDKDVTIRLRVIDRFKSLLDKDVGIIAGKDVFSDVLEEDDGRVIPLVYGKADKVRAVCVKGPKGGRLMEACGKDDATLYIERGEEFPQGTPCVIRIGWEYIYGSFNGNTFAVTKRGCGPNADGSYLTGTVGAPAHPENAQGEKDFRRVNVSGLGGIDDQYVGLWLGADVGTQYQPGEVYFRAASPSSLYARMSQWPGNSSHDSKQWRPINSYDATNGRLEVACPYVREGNRTVAPDDRLILSGTQVLLAPGSTLYIGSLPAPHNAGEDVYEVLDEYVYALNAARSKAVKAAYFYGVKGEWRVPSDYMREAVDAGGGFIGLFDMVSPEGPGLVGGGMVARGQDGGAWYGLVGSVFRNRETDYQEIPSRFYSMNLNDTTWGPVLTTITLKMLPVWIPYFRPQSLEIWADLAGAADAAGDLLENPARVIRDVLENRLGISSEDIDGASFGAAEGATNWLHLAGALERVVSGYELVADIAFQSRCRVRFEAGKIYLDYLKNGLAASAVPPAITKSLAVRDTLILDWEDAGEVINEIEFTWRDDQRRRRTARVQSAASIGAYGRKRASVEFWLHQLYQAARQVAQFWLERWAWPWRRGRVAGYLPFLPFQRGDTIEVTYDDWGLEGQKAEALDIAHTPGGAGRMDEIAVDFRLPLRSGCASGCETYCETGCEADCENWCQTACELDCQTACETACQGLCQLACQVWAQVGQPQWFGCALGNRVGVADGRGPGAGDGFEAGFEGNTCTGCTSCQGSCVSGNCQSGCETACQPSYTVNQCESQCIVGSCESTCQLTCTTVCEHACQTCQTSCQLGCQYTCEPACEGVCQSVCQMVACETACEVNHCENACQVGCEVACETEHMTNQCDSGCIVGGCETYCTAASCETACEPGATASTDCDLACTVASAMSACNLTLVSG